MKRPARIVKAMEELVSLNDDHEFSSSRDEFVQMLDTELAQ